MGKYFGGVVGHDRADENGITEIANLAGNEGYLGASNTDHPLHTGGVYSDEPPIVILLQCIKQSTVGGDSILVSSKLIYDYLSRVDPDGLEKLKKNDVVTIKRGSSQASRSIFDNKYLENNNYMFSFRCDNVVEFNLNPSDILLTLARIKAFIDEPVNQLKFRLKPNQLMIADNTAVMHARTAFPETEGRRLLRLTPDGKVDPKITGHEINLGFAA